MPSTPATRRLAQLSLQVAPCEGDEGFRSKAPGGLAKLGGKTSTIDGYDATKAWGVGWGEFNLVKQTNAADLQEHQYGSVLVFLRIPRVVLAS